MELSGYATIMMVGYTWSPQAPTFMVEMCYILMFMVLLKLVLIQLFDYCVPA